jgi:hypothetical protein
MLTVKMRPLVSTNAGSAEYFVEQSVRRRARTVRPVNGKRGMIPTPTDATLLNTSRLSSRLEELFRIASAYAG